MLRAVLPIGFLLLAPAAQAGKIELLSKAGGESDTAINLSSAPVNPHPPSVSADGRWIAFSSTAVNLAAGQRDSNGYRDVFLHDRQTGSTVLVSHAAGSSGSTGSGGASEPASISDDGRWVVYESDADDLVPGQVSKKWENQIFLYDRDTGVNALVSHSFAGPGVGANGYAGHARISGDGDWIAFESAATDLLPGQSDTPDIVDVFLYERATGQMTLVSRAAGGTPVTAANQHSERPAVSRDGRYAAFRSQATNLIPGFRNSDNSPTPMNVFLFDRVTGTMILVSHTRGSATIGASGWSPAISPDGAAVVFGSFGTNLLDGQIDTSFSWDVFLFDRMSGTNLLVSHAESSLTTCAGAFQDDDNASVAAGGAWVAFTGLAGNPIRGQIYLFRRSDSALTLVSRSAASPAQAANHHSYTPRLTPDGAFVAFASMATDLVAGQSGPPTLHIYLFDRAAGTLTLASGAGGSGHTPGNSMSMAPAVSDDGAVVAYYTLASDLDPGTADLNGTLDLALYDRNAAATTLASLHAPGQASSTASASSFLVSASADGRYAVFLSTAVNVVPGQVDRNSTGYDVFLVDRVAGTTTLVSHAAGLPAATGDGRALSAVISADGAYIVFISLARDHVPGQVDTNYGDDAVGMQFPGYDVFLYNRAAGSTTLVSHAAGSNVTAGNYTCFDEAGISADGRYITYSCGAEDLVPGQSRSGFLLNIFLHDRVAGTTTLVSRKAGTVAISADNVSSEPVISRDGRWIGFLSYATDLVAGEIDTNYENDVFLFDRVTGQTLLVSRVAGTAATAAGTRSQGLSLNANGRNLVFSSLAGNLVPGQTGGRAWNVFLFDRFTGVVELISRAAGTATTTVAGAQDASISANGRYVVFRSSAANLVPGQTAGSTTMNVFVHDRATRRMELISRSTLSPLRPSDGHALKPTLSPNGRYVAFLSQATDLAPGAPRLRRRGGPILPGVARKPGRL
jgi:Tol biopolymer transport system component